MYVFEHSVMMYFGFLGVLLCLDDGFSLTEFLLVNLVSTRDQKVSERVNRIRWHFLAQLNESLCQVRD